jgi:hypothetical protein
MTYRLFYWPEIQGRGEFAATHDRRFLGADSRHASSGGLRTWKIVCRNSLAISSGCWPGSAARSTSRALSSFTSTCRWFRSSRGCRTLFQTQWRESRATTGVCSRCTRESRSGRGSRRTWPPGGAFPSTSRASSATTPRSIPPESPCSPAVYPAFTQCSKERSQCCNPSYDKRTPVIVRSGITLWINR